MPTSLQGAYALVTGASSGLGVEFARQLAARGCNLILVARREERLRALQAELASAHPGRAIITIPLDLAPPDGPQRLYDIVQEQGTAVEILVNNAGVGVWGHFTETPWQQEQQLIELDIRSLVHLTKLFVRDMLGRDSGYILQIASVAAYQPTPTFACYAAAKSFVLHFGEALNYELRRSNVSCTVLAPGITDTEFFTVAGQPKNFYHRMMMMQSADVVRIGIEGMLKRQPSIVPGWLNKISTVGARMLPRKLVTAMAYQAMTRQ